MSMIPGGLSDPKMSELADDNERAIAVLRMNLVILLRERDEMQAQYLEVRAIQDKEIRLLEEEIERKEGLRDVEKNIQRLGVHSDSGDA